MADRARQRLQQPNAADATIRQGHRHQRSQAIARVRGRHYREKCLTAWFERKDARRQTADGVQGSIELLRGRGDEMNGLGLRNTLSYLQTTARQSALTTTARFIINPTFINAQGVPLLNQMRRIGKSHAMQDRQSRRRAANLQPGNAQVISPAPLIACGWANFKWAKGHGSVPTKSLARELAVQGATVVMMSEKGTTERDSTGLSHFEEHTVLGQPSPNLPLTNDVRLQVPRCTQHPKKRLRRSHQPPAGHRLRLHCTLPDNDPQNPGMPLHLTSTCPTNLPPLPPQPGVLLHRLRRSRTTPIILHQPAQAPPARVIVDRDINAGSDMRHLLWKYCHDGGARVAWNVPTGFAYQPPPPNLWH
ncbi:hypothetical protein DFS34DRAFT_625702 [Phlyctochytrium arcticum]|nr:hypothetical protein DFS34DRAFT_625702 [Phlyctochytrium arcticum]